ncbi:acyl-CoA reductase [Aquimarina brevivitae]|uniref:Acyl-CoA reductase LuxC n=1 Tax=Aquimarina brevivitae TaxID=323412 RepID=A0A4Q7P2Q9_9FLAO|nr:acyl-CoA reductase [Aquimarina brevivitae]RZS93660.1 acyl-CoA reductase LuxC [Aquimarina brevivitae]
MGLTQRIHAFAKLGSFLDQFKTTGYQKVTSLDLNTSFYDKFVQKIESASHYNGWFTKDNMLFAIEQWAAALQQTNLEEWLSRYAIPEVTPKKVGVIMAGNIPLVGFHDFLCVLISGHHIIVKQSSNDAPLLPLISKILIAIDKDFENKIAFTEDRMNDFDAIIATGSNNTARYFEYYFKDVPSIIRKNRNSVAILTGEETPEQLHQLGEDIFRYYGLGCRSVSKLFVPKDYDFDKFFKSIYLYHDIIEGNKYANNYDYNKAVYLMSDFKLLENGFLILKEDTSYSSPIGTLFYEKYDELDELLQQLQADEEKIQCIVGNQDIDKQVKFGQTQTPQLIDYADGVDTIEFLIKIQ